MIGSEELETRLTYHSPSVNQADRMAHIRNAALNLASLIDATCPDSREKSLAVTAVEEASMWANAAIARRE